MEKLYVLKLTEEDKRLPVYVTTVGRWDHQLPIRRMDGFPGYHWLQTISGEGELMLEEETYPVRAGQGFFLYPNIPHVYQAVREPWEVCWVTFDGEHAGAMAGLAGFTCTGVYSSPDMISIQDFITSMMRIAAFERLDAGMECSKLIYALLLEFKKRLAPSGRPQRLGHNRLLPAIEYIERHYRETITIQDLAQQVGVTPQHLCVLFKSTFQQRPIEYMNRERIHRSKELMLRCGGSLKMYEIAREVGFEHASYFSAVFKRLEGCTPEQFVTTHGMR